MQPAPPGFVRLQRSAFDRELHRRGLTGAQLAKLAGLTEPTLSRIRNGACTRDKTFKQIATALLSVPVVEGADLLLDPPVGEE
jgi:transcriptional regulator with XRE-family HTH domain